MVTSFPRTRQILFKSKFNEKKLSLGHTVFLVIIILLFCFYFFSDNVVHRKGHHKLLTGRIEQGFWKLFQNFMTFDWEWRTQLSFSPSRLPCRITYPSLFLYLSRCRLKEFACKLTWGHVFVLIEDYFLLLYLVFCTCSIFRKITGWMVGYGYRWADEWPRD